MKKFSLVIALAFLFTRPASAANTEIGECKVVFDASGHAASVTVIKSTGSKTLDKNSVSWALQHWSGTPNTTKQMPLVLYRTPAPPYPREARAAHLSGAGVCHVTFDDAGHASKVEMTQSTGSDFLDANTVAFARQNWTGGPNTKVSIPIRYLLR